LDLGVSGFYPSGAIDLHLVSGAADHLPLHVSGKCKDTTQIPLKRLIADLLFLLAFGEAQSNLPLPL